MNPSVLEMSGFRQEEFIDVRNIDFIHPDELQVVAELIRDSYVHPGQSIKAQVRARHHDGHYLWIEGIITNLLDDHEVKAFVLNFRDITDRKKAEMLINELNESLEQKIETRTSQLEALNKELEAFTYSVSHDLRAPLRAINGYAKLLQENYSDMLDSDAKNFIDIIRSNATNMGQLIDDLLAFSKLGRKAIDISKVDMNQLVRDIESELVLSYPHKAKINIGPMPVIYTDATLIHQVMYNLMSNAVKYSSKKDNPIVTISAEENKKEVVFSVKDNGAGFDMRHSNKLFGVFNRLHTQAEFDGVGVGLAIVKRIIEKFDGAVWAEGKLNEGATFYSKLNK